MRIRWIGILLLAGILHGLPVLAQDLEPLMLRTGPQLLIDNWLIDEGESRNLYLDLHQPERRDEPVIGKDEKWHQWPLFFLRVLPDPEKPDTLRMWYNIRNSDYEPARTAYAYAESEDGVEWRRSHLGIVDLEGSTENNLFLTAPGTWEFGMFFVDHGPQAANPDRRYILATEMGGDMQRRYSADGLHFTDPVPYDMPDMGDIIDGVWDPLTQRYLAVFKVMGSPEDGYTGQTANVQQGHRRLVGMSTSADFETWEQPWRIIESDPLEAGVWEFYGMVPRVRGQLYVGFLRVLRDDLPAEPGGDVRGIGWTELCTSRDGRTWTRYRDEAFIPRSEKPEAFDRAMAWFGDIVTVGDEDLIYYGGYREGHKVGDRQIGMARMRKNGFASRNAGAQGGKLVTKPVVLAGEAMTINANVRGELKARVLDATTGEPAAGFDFADFEAITGDSVAHPAKWNGDWKSLAGKPVRLEIEVKDAELFGFELES